MTNTHKPHMDQQPKPEDEAMDSSEHNNRLGGDPDVPRKAGQGQSRSQKQSQS